MNLLANKPTTIFEFQDYLKALYRENNESEGFEYIYSYLARNCSYLSRTLARNGEAEAFYLKSFSWLFALATNQNINIEEALRKKFPNVCPYCIISPCKCGETNKQPYTDMAEDNIKTDLKQKYDGLVNRNPHLDIDTAVANMNHIYPANRSIWAAYGSTFHFSRVFEELGEIHEAYGNLVHQRNNADINLREELADVFAWLLSAWGISQNRKPLSKALIEYYKEGCPVCRRNVCACHKYSSRPQATPKAEDIDALNVLLKGLISAHPENKHLRDISESLENAKSSGITTETKRVVAQVPGVLENLETVEKSTRSISETASHVSNLVKTITALIASLPWL